MLNGVRCIGNLPAQTLFTNKVYHTVLMSRDKATKQVEIYMNGVLQVSFVDSDNVNLYSGDLRVFVDDGSESDTGRADCFAMLDGPVTSRDAAMLVECADIKKFVSFWILFLCV